MSTFALEPTSAVSTPCGIAETLEGSLDTLRCLVEADRVEAARALAVRLLSAWPEDRRVQRWARVLAPPRVFPASNDDPRQAPIDRSAELGWLDAHRHEHPGCWISLSGSRLILADPSLARVVAENRRVLEDQPALLWFEPVSSP